MPIYSPAPKAVFGLATDLMERKFPELVEHEVTLAILMAHPAKRGQAALKLHGTPAEAIIKVTGYEERAKGGRDSGLRIDSRVWERLSDDEREALLFHELHHLVLVRDKQGYVKSDDLGRPRLKCRPHDLEIGVFRRVYDEYGKASPEHRMRQAYEQLFEQQLLPFEKAEDEAPTRRRKTK